MRGAELRPNSLQAECGSELWRRTESTERCRQLAVMLLWMIAHEQPAAVAQLISMNFHSSCALIAKDNTSPNRLRELCSRAYIFLEFGGDGSQPHLLKITKNKLRSTCDFLKIMLDCKAIGTGGLECMERLAMRAFGVLSMRSEFRPLLLENDAVLIVGEFLMQQPTADSHFLELEAYATAIMTLYNIILHPDCQVEVCRQAAPELYAGMKWGAQTLPTISQEDTVKYELISHVKTYASAALEILNRNPSNRTEMYKLEMQEKTRVADAIPALKGASLRQSLDAALMKVGPSQITQRPSSAGPETHRMEQALIRTDYSPRHRSPDRDGALYSFKADPPQSTFITQGKDTSYRSVPDYVSKRERLRSASLRVRHESTRNSTPASASPARMSTPGSPSRDLVPVGRPTTAGLPAAKYDPERDRRNSRLELNVFMQMPTSSLWDVNHTNCKENPWQNNRVNKIRMRHQQAWDAAASQPQDAATTTAVSTMPTPMPPGGSPDVINPTLKCEVVQKASVPACTVFKHVPGCQFCLNLYEHVQLPNGDIVHCYINKLPTNKTANVTLPTPDVSMMGALKHGLLQSILQKQLPDFTDFLLSLINSPDGGQEGLKAALSRVAGNADVPEEGLDYLDKLLEAVSGINIHMMLNFKSREKAAAPVAQVVVDTPIASQGWEVPRERAESCAGTLREHWRSIFAPRKKECDGKDYYDHEVGAKTCLTSAPGLGHYL
ncbi:hypothetical protein CYMTET_35578 [Cymbomonas tetramitiformis]|uniref:Uncharacterized protein n=1 Tax=Cymbomonas tetramitiformis TaxID=36881 RepID=A0AAE0KP17_9CHLO|nr:hypothetical protein CYMTET_35578 [Cymbomonas tetramitiformis]